MSGSVVYVSWYLFPTQLSPSPLSNTSLGTIDLRKGEKKIVLSSFVGFDIWKKSHVTWHCCRQGIGILKATNVRNGIGLQIYLLGYFFWLNICCFVKNLILVSIMGSLRQDYVGKITNLLFIEVVEVIFCVVVLSLAEG